MIKFWRLVSGELIKHFSKVGSWVIAGIVILYCIGAGGIFGYFKYQQNTFRNRNMQNEINYIMNEIDNVQAPDEYKAAIAEVSQILRSFIDEKITSDDWRYTALRDRIYSTIYGYKPGIEGKTVEPGGPDNRTENFKALQDIVVIIKANDWKAYMQMKITEAEKMAASGDMYAKQKVDILKYQLEHNARDAWVENEINNIANYTSQLENLNQQLVYLDDENFGQGMGKTQEEIEKMRKDEKEKINSQIKFFEEQSKISYYRIENKIPSESGNSFFSFLSQTSNIFLVVLLTLVLAGSILAVEFSSGTIKLLR